MIAVHFVYTEVSSDILWKSFEHDFINVINILVCYGDNSILGELAGFVIAIIQVSKVADGPITCIKEFLWNPDDEFFSYWLS